MNDTLKYYEEQENKKLAEAYKEMVDVRAKHMEMSNAYRKLQSTIDKLENAKKEREEKARKERMKKTSPHRFMNLVFYWDNGQKFDTRPNKGHNTVGNSKASNLYDFKDMVFNYGLPTKFEVRG